ncbi:DUF6941 family protein [Chloroflexota bacterium]
MHNDTKLKRQDATMELQVLLCADYANVAEGGKLNVMGVFRNIYSKAFPARQPEMQIIVKLRATPAEIGQTRKITIKLMDDDAKTELVNFSRDIEVPRPAGRQQPEINQILRIRDVVFPEPGTYQFSVLVDNDEKGTLPIELELMQ